MVLRIATNESIRSASTNKSASAPFASSALAANRSASFRLPRRWRWPAKRISISSRSRSHAPSAAGLQDHGLRQSSSSCRSRRRRKETKTHSAEAEGIGLRPKTDGHDVETKISQARQFLERRDKVLIYVFYKGQELQAHRGEASSVSRRQFAGSMVTTSLQGRSGTPAWKASGCRAMLAADVIFVGPDHHSCLLRPEAESPKLLLSSLRSYPREEFFWPRSRRSLGETEVQAEDSMPKQKDAQGLQEAAHAFPPPEN